GTNACGDQLVPEVSKGFDFDRPGVHTVVYTVTDGGRIATAYRTVTVSDTLAPVPDLLSLQDVTGECSATVIVIPTATDKCEGAKNGTTNDPLSYSTLGTHVITWTYSDSLGHTSQQTQNVVVTDTTNPTIQLKMTTVQPFPNDHKYRTIKVSDLV